MMLYMVLLYDPTYHLSPTPRITSPLPRVSPLPYPAYHLSPTPHITSLLPHVSPLPYPTYHLSPTPRITSPLPRVSPLPYPTYYLSPTPRRSYTYRSMRFVTSALWPCSLHWRYWTWRGEWLVQEVTVPVPCSVL